LYLLVEFCQDKKPSFLCKILNSAGFTVEIPTTGTGYNYTVDWGDGITTTGHTENATHTYAAQGEYQLSITGEFPRISVSHAVPFYNQIISVDQWGDQKWLSMERAFAGCFDLSINTSDAPDLSKVESMSYMFFGANITGNIGDWDVSNITDMSNLFSRSFNFNLDLRNWDVSKVTDMNHMFSSCTEFNQDISNWDVSNATDMKNMFSNAKAFNQDLGAWNVSKVTDMESMFDTNFEFNQDIGSWDVSKVENMANMFARATEFDQDIGNWDVSKVTDMQGMFYYAQKFNKDISTWDVSNVVDMEEMFSVASEFNQNIGEWDVSNVTNFEDMFSNAADFNQDISDWDMSSATTLKGMFFRAFEFNQNIGKWDVSNVTDCEDMFARVHSFDQNLGNWDISNVTNMTDMFEEPLNDYFPHPMSQKNYDAMLIGWASIEPNRNITLELPIEYCLGKNARQHLINNYDWVINDFGESNFCYESILEGSSYLAGNDCNEVLTHIPQQKFAIQSDSEMFHVISNYNGKFVVPLDTGSYSIRPILADPSQFEVTPNSIEIESPIDVADNNILFCINPKNNISDIAVSLIPLDDAMPGFNASYRVVIRNKGNQRLSERLNLNFQNSILDVVSTSPQAEIIGNNIHWNFTDLLPYESFSYLVEFNINSPMETPAVNAGDILSFTANVLQIDNELNASDNIMRINQTVINSFDPNYKTCLEGEFLEEALIGEYVHYKIRFENTGTADAVNIRVTDDIDESRFDISTLEVVDASHSVQTTIIRNKVAFEFNEIYLPFEDALNDGYLVFKIKTLDNLTLGMQLENQAKIYFDFNSPIITNTATSTFDNMSDTQILANALNLDLRPNPVHSVLNISSDEYFSKLAVYDLQGKQQNEFEFSSLRNYETIDLSGLDSGIYLVNIISASGTRSSKKIVKH